MRFRNSLFSFFIIAALVSLGAQPVATAIRVADYEKLKLSDGSTAALPTPQYLNDLLVMCGSFAEYDKRLGCAGAIASIAAKAGSLKYRAGVQGGIAKIHTGFGFFVSEYVEKDAMALAEQFAQFNKDYGAFAVSEIAAYAE